MLVVPWHTWRRAWLGLLRPHGAALACHRVGSGSQGRRARQALAELALGCALHQDKVEKAEKARKAEELAAKVAE